MDLKSAGLDPVAGGPIEVSAHHFRERVSILLDRALLADQTVLIGTHLDRRHDPFVPLVALIPYAEYAELVAQRNNPLAACERLATVNTTD